MVFAIVRERLSPIHSVCCWLSRESWIFAMFCNYFPLVYRRTHRSRSHHLQSRPLTLRIFITAAIVKLLFRLRPFFTFSCHRFCTRKAANDFSHPMRALNLIQDNLNSLTEPRGRPFSICPACVRCARELLSFVCLNDRSLLWFPTQGSTTTLVSGSFVQILKVMWRFFW